MKHVENTLFSEVPYPVKNRRFFAWRRHLYLCRAKVSTSGVPRGYLGGGFQPPPEIPKALQNRAKLNPIVKTIKNG